jgi:hypothetical protein
MRPAIKYKLSHYASRYALRSYSIVFAGTLKPQSVHAVQREESGSKRPASVLSDSFP